MTSCVLCEPPALPEYRVVTGRHCWISIQQGSEFPGWFAVGSIAHRDGFGTLKSEEASEFGQMVAALSGAIKRVMPAQKVYVLGTGERHEHAHVALIPRLESDATRGLDFLALSRVPDVAASLKLAYEVRSDARIATWLE